MQYHRYRSDTQALCVLEIMEEAKFVYNYVNRVIQLTYHSTKSHNDSRGRRCKEKALPPASQPAPLLLTPFNVINNYIEGG